MQLSQTKLFKLILLFLLLFITSTQLSNAQETDILDFLPAILAAAASNTNNVWVPLNQFNIGDSIGEGEAADGIIGLPNHETVWSTGYNWGDTVYSLNERFEDSDALRYFENNDARDYIFNHADSGAIMADFAAQAGDIATAASLSTPSGSAGMITILLGNNDVCAPSLNDMTDPVLFEAQYRAGLDVLANSPATSSAYIHVSSIPAIYWLWNVKRDNAYCRLVAWPFVPCENLLTSPEIDDCASSTSRLDPDTIYPGDGTNCIRRKTFHAGIRDIYNPILRGVLQEYIDSSKLPNAYFIDIFDVILNGSHINDSDCFHPSEAGHALLSEEEWCRSQWGMNDLTCAP
jgi:lysophospholipase L1-like esterase